jgi:hypothetical protein
MSIQVYDGDGKAPAKPRKKEDYLSLSCASHRITQDEQIYFSQLMMASYCELTSLKRMVDSLSKLNLPRLTRIISLNTEGEDQKPILRSIGEWTIIDIAFFDGDGGPPDENTGLYSATMEVRPLGVDYVEPLLDDDGNPIPPAINISLKTQAVTAIPRKLRTKWSMDTAQDIQAGIDSDIIDDLTRAAKEENAKTRKKKPLSDIIWTPGAE